MFQIGGWRGLIANFDTGLKSLLLPVWRSWCLWACVPISLPLGAIGKLMVLGRAFARRKAFRMRIELVWVPVMHMALLAGLIELIAEIEHLVGILLLDRIQHELRGVV